MKRTSVYELSQQEILDLISGAIGHPVTAENIRWKLKETGDHDRGTFRRTMEGLTVTLDDKTEEGA